MEKGWTSWGWAVPSSGQAGAGLAKLAVSRNKFRVYLLQIWFRNKFIHSFICQNSWVIFRLLKIEISSSFKIIEVVFSPLRKVLKTSSICHNIEFVFHFLKIKVVFHLCKKWGCLPFVKNWGCLPFSKKLRLSSNLGPTTLLYGYLVKFCSFPAISLLVLAAGRPGGCWIYKN
jgi:hypothetical protein